jgi:hypothetical protein
LSTAKWHTCSAPPRGDDGGGGAAASRARLPALLHAAAALLLLLPLLPLLLLLLPLPPLLPPPPVLPAVSTPAGGLAVLSAALSAYSEAIDSAPPPLHTSTPRPCTRLSVMGPPPDDTLTWLALSSPTCQQQPCVVCEQHRVC